jgi:hypothetical protein
MAADPYIPRADKDFRRFAENFANNIHRNPAMFCLTPAEAASIMQALVRFNDAYTIANDPPTRTRPTIADKDDARSILQNKISNYAAYIRSNLGITDGDKVRIGVRPRNVAHKSRKCPTTVPLLNFIGSLPGIDQLCFHDSNRPESKAKPYGTVHLELYVAYSLPGEARPKKEQATYLGPFKKSKMLVMRDPEQGAPGGGAQPTYWARWRGFDGVAGPWSLPCSMSLARKKASEQTQGTSESGESEQPLKLAA